MADLLLLEYTMQHPTDNSLLNPSSIDWEEYWASISADYADPQFPTDAQDPTYTWLSPVQTPPSLPGPSREGPSASPAVTTNESPVASSSSSAARVPAFTGSDFYYPFTMAMAHEIIGDDTALQPQSLHLSLPSPPNDVSQQVEDAHPSPLSPSGSGSAPALSRSSSKRRRQATPSLSEEDQYDLPPLSANATKKQRQDHKREQNKLAARRARRRLANEKDELRGEVARKTREVDIWRERTRMMQGILHKAGVKTPRFPDIV